VEERGVPLSIVVTGANRHDVSQLETVLAAIVVERPTDDEQHLCGDMGYGGKPAAEIIERFRYITHVRSRGEEVADKKHQGGKARRWVVEAAHSWFNRFRKLLVRYEKTEASYLALMHLAASIICWRKVGFIYGYVLNL
jgi:putative transposase